MLEPRSAEKSRCFAAQRVNVMHFVLERLLLGMASRVVLQATNFAQLFEKTSAGNRKLLARRSTEFIRQRKMRLASMDMPFGLVKDT